MRASTVSVCFFPSRLPTPTASNGSVCISSYSEYEIGHCHDHIARITCTTRGESGRRGRSFIRRVTTHRRAWILRHKGRPPQGDDLQACNNWHKSSQVQESEAATTGTDAALAPRRLLHRVLQSIYLTRTFRAITRSRKMTNVLSFCSHSTDSSDRTAFVLGFAR